MKKGESMRALDLLFIQQGAHPFATSGMPIRKMRRKKPAFMLIKLEWPKKSMSIIGIEVTIFFCIVPLKMTPITGD